MAGKYHERVHEQKNALVAFMLDPKAGVIFQTDACCVHVREICLALIQYGYDYRFSTKSGV